MTWNARSEGPRVLTKNETILFCYAILVLVRFKDGVFDMFEQDIPPLFISSKFSALSEAAIFAILEKTCRSLMEDTGDNVPEITWYNESAIYYIYWFFGEHVLCPLLSYLKQYRNEATNKRRTKKLKVVAKHAKDLVKLLQEIANLDSDDAESDQDLAHERKARKLRLKYEDIKSMIENSVDKILWDRDFEESMMDLYGKSETLSYYANYQEDRAYPHEGAGERLFDYALATLKELNFFEGDNQLISTAEFHTVFDVMHDAFYMVDEEEL